MKLPVLLTNKAKKQQLRTKMQIECLGISTKQQDLYAIVYYEDQRFKLAAFENL